jgi:2-polyprenyl-6-hydroxyphenyl methylase/3-demethylubiquinone-9 3-methyltransferase
LERPASALYRRLFLDLDDLVERLAALGHVTEILEILEIGCGEGAVTERLVRRFASARVTAIDPMAEPGRQYRGDRDRVRFLPERAEAVALRSPGRFDLVLICDVLHHVCPADRPPLLEAASRALRPGGRIVVKEWEPTRTPIHALTYLLERSVGGPVTRYETAAPWRQALTHEAGVDVQPEARVRPWHNNVLLVSAPAAPGARSPAGGGDVA